MADKKKNNILQDWSNVINSISFDTGETHITVDALQKSMKDTTVRLCRGVTEKHGQKELYFKLNGTYQIWLAGKEFLSTLSIEMAVEEYNKLQ
jgi:hypothetical protein